jgi:epoxyqueuosine reductase
MPHQHPELEPIPEILNFTEKDWEDLKEEQFKVLFKFSPIKRSKFKGFKRNLKFLKTDK